MLTLNEDLAEDLATWAEVLELEEVGAEALGVPAGRYERVALQHVSDHRWHTKYLVVFRLRDHEGQHAPLGFHYLRPVTEVHVNQSVFEGVPVPVFPVTGRDVTTILWEPDGSART